MTQRWNGWSRRLCAQVILAWLLCAPVWAAGLPDAADLGADGQLARTSGAPILVLFSRDNCTWCNRIRRNHLEPLVKAGKPAAIVRVIHLDKDLPLRDFDGHTTSHRDFASRQRINFAPTLGFYGSNGEIISPALVGFRVADYYDYYIERALTEGAAKLKGSAP